MPTVHSRRDVLVRAAGGAATLAVLSRLGAAHAQASLKIATIGAGREGGVLGTLYAKAGHPVMFSSRHPEQLKDLVDAAGANAKAGPVGEAVEFADVVLLVVPYGAVPEIGKEYAAALAKKKLVVDVSNPIARRDGEETVKWANERGGAGLATASVLPGAHVVRAFNAISYARLPELAARQGSDKIAIPIAGDDKAALALATDLVKEIGFEPVVVGGLAMGKFLVPGTPLAGEHSAAEIRQIAATLK